MEYDFEETILMIKGHQDEIEDQLKNVRLMAWASIAPHSSKKITPEQLMPLPGDKVGRGALSKMDESEKLKKAKELKQRYFDAGLLSNN